MSQPTVTLSADQYDALAMWIGAEVRAGVAHVLEPTEASRLQDSANLWALVAHSKLTGEPLSPAAARTLADQIRSTQKAAAPSEGDGGSVLPFRARP